MFSASRLSALSIHSVSVLSFRGAAFRIRRSAAGTRLVLSGRHTTFRPGSRFGSGRAGHAAGSVFRLFLRVFFLSGCAGAARA